MTRPMLCPGILSGSAVIGGSLLAQSCHTVGTMSASHPGMGVYGARQSEAPAAPLHYLQSLAKPLSSFRAPM